MAGYTIETTADAVPQPDAAPAAGRGEHPRGSAALDGSELAEILKRAQMAVDPRRLADCSPSPSM
jgi:hypothetical protein